MKNDSRAQDRQSDRQSDTDNGGLSNDTICHGLRQLVFNGRDTTKLRFSSRSWKTVLRALDLRYISLSS